MKKFITSILLLATVFIMSACGSNESKEQVSDGGERQEDEKVVIQGLNASRERVDVEVPYNPERIAVLDMAALDIIDYLDLGDRIVGSAQVSIDYLSDYNPDETDGEIMNLGTIKTADLEKVAASDPDIIFIGGRLSGMYEDLQAIAPVVYLRVDYEQGIVESTKENVLTIASIFGKDIDDDQLLPDLTSRIEELKNILNGRNVLLGMFTSNALTLMDTQSQLNIITNELGAHNLGETVGEEEKATHGEEASWETIISLDPEYLFVLDRSTAVGENDASSQGAREVIENDLIKQLDVYKNDQIVYFIDHANVWYTAVGGVQALDTMLADLEEALIQE